MGICYSAIHSFKCLSEMKTLSKNSDFLMAQDDCSSGLCYCGKHLFACLFSFELLNWIECDFTILLLLT